MYIIKLPGYEYLLNLIDQKVAKLLNSPTDLLNALKINEEIKYSKLEAEAFFQIDSITQQQNELKKILKNINNN